MLTTQQLLHSSTDYVVEKPLIKWGFFFYNQYMNQDTEQAVSLNSASKPQPTWFFERGDGKIFAVGEQEAWNLIKNKTEWMRRDFKMLGHSDGSIYFETIKNSKKEAADLLDEKKELKRVLTRYKDTEDNLRFKELKDEDDEMMVKVTTKIKNLNKEIEEINKKLSNFNSTIIDKAFNLELEKAKDNIIMPKNSDVVTPRKEDRERIMNQLGKK